MDTSLLNKVYYYKTYWWGQKFYWQHGIYEEQFTDWEPLLAGLLDVMTYFRSSMEILASDNKTGQVISFSHPAQAKEAA